MSTIIDKKINNNEKIGVEKKKFNKKQMIGTVMSTKMTNTITVRAINNKLHPIYKKVVKQFKKLMAHNEIEGIKVGDKVRLIESRPLSKNKKWVVVGKLDK